MICLDLVVIFDFEVGVMENWGLFIFREEIFLYDNVIFLVVDRKLVIKIIVYELVY